MSAIKLDPKQIKIKDDNLDHIEEDYFEKNCKNDTDYYLNEGNADYFDQKNEDDLDRAYNGDNE
jgi:hypothetical protein